jgi:hypothetical protein
MRRPFYLLFFFFLGGVPKFLGIVFMKLAWAVRSSLLFEFSTFSLLFPDRCIGG